MKIDAIALSEDNGWANGCGHCTCGVIDPPAMTGHTAPLYIARAVQFRFGVLACCDCRAGKAYERYMVRVGEQIDSRAEHVPDTWWDALLGQVNALQRAPTFNRAYA